MPMNPIAKAGNIVTNQLRWQCRRGMLEIDLLLADFLDHGYAALTAAETVVFETLLACPDTLLLEWLMGRERPTDGVQAHVIERIRAVAAH